VPGFIRLIQQIMQEHGVDAEKLYFDVPRLHSAYPSHFLSAGIAHAFDPHRDTWYAAPMCQLNWWIPINLLDLPASELLAHGAFDNRLV
jgi:hypothetical protein